MGISFCKQGVVIYPDGPNVAVSSVYRSASFDKTVLGSLAHKISSGSTTAFRSSLERSSVLSSSLQQVANSRRNSALMMSKRHSRPSSCTGQDPAAAAAEASGGLDESPWIVRQTEDIGNVYYMTEVLGQGQFGTIQLAMAKRTGDRYACKTISKRKLEAPEQLDLIRREVEIMHHLAGHPNIVQLQAVYEDQNSIHLVMELCDGGDLFEQLSNHGPYSEADAARLVKNMLQSVQYCHSLGVMHRDIKPENFLLSDTGLDAELKLIDFGMSMYCTEGETFDQVCGSAYYLAPEVVNQNYSKEADIWSIGVILYILLSGFPPFDGVTDSVIMHSIVHDHLDVSGDPVWQSVSKEAVTLVRAMLEKDPRKRASIPELLASRWFTGSNSSAPLPDAVFARLKKFSAMHDFKKEARRVLASFLPSEEVMGLQQLFWSIDTDDSGTITLPELRAALINRNVQLPEKELKLLLKRADINGDGVIDYSEFMAALVSLSKLHKDELITKAFKHFDADGSGYITHDELTAALATHKGLQDVAAPQSFFDHGMQALLAEVDTDDDGRISYAEFAAMMRKGEDVDSTCAGDAPDSMAALLSPSSPVYAAAMVDGVCAKGSRDSAMAMFQL